MQITHPAGPSFRQILVPLDGSVLAEKALPHAVGLARVGLGKLLLLRVAPCSEHSRALAELGYLESMLEEERVRCRQAEGYLEEVRRRPELRDHVAAVRVVWGSPAHEILAVDEADLIVLTSRGRGGSGRHRMGNLAERIVRHSRCPVMIVNAHPDN